MKRYLIFSLISLFLSVLFTLAVIFIDVRPEGLIGTNIGLASLNLSVASFLDRNLLFYKIADYLGYLCFVIVAFYGIQGLIQLIRKKSIFRVDKRILTLGGIYLIIGIIYVVFNNIFVLNYRPVFIGAELESSFPSSHTLMALVVCVTSFFSLKHYIKNARLAKALNVCTVLLGLAIVTFRVFSGTHWITDIIASALYSVTLIFAFLALNYKSRESVESHEQNPSSAKPSSKHASSHR